MAISGSHSALWFLSEILLKWSLICAWGWWPVQTRAEFHTKKKSLPWAVKRCSCRKQTLEAIFKCPKMHYSNFKSPAPLQCGIVTDCCSAVRECGTLHCKNPSFWADQRLSSALVLQRFGDWAREKRKVCSASSPAGGDWRNIRSRLHGPVGNSVLVWVFFSTACQSPWWSNFTPTGRQRKEREM